LPFKTYEMANYEIPYFGALNLQQLEAYATETIEFKNRSVTIDMNLLNGNSVSEAEMKVIKGFLENLESYTNQIGTILPTDYSARGATYDYMEEFLRELDDEDLLSALHGTDEELSTEERMFQKFYIKRISFYPEKEDELLAVIDYAISGNVTEDVLVVMLNKQMKLKGIVIERG
jgi:hypothetical protein